MAYTFTRTGAQIEEIHNTVEDPKSNTQFSDNIRTIAGEYRGLWPDTGGSANKGDTYQAQVSGAGTGQYFTALQDTTVDPVGDNVNWRVVVSVDSFSQYTDIVYKASGDNSAVENMVAGVPVAVMVGDKVSTGVGVWLRIASSGLVSDFKPLNGLWVDDFYKESDPDSLNSIQEAVDTGIYKLSRPVKKVILSDSTYEYSGTIHLGYGDSFTTCHLKGMGVSVNADSYGGTKLICNNTDAPAVNVQGARVTYIESMSIFGAGWDELRARDPGGSGTDGDTRYEESHYEYSLASVNAYSDTAPWCGICIDGYSGDSPAIPYPDVDYPSFLPQTQYNKNFSDTVKLIDVSIEGFGTSVVIQPSGSDGNGDFVSLTRVFCRYHKYGFSVGNSQARESNLIDCKFRNGFTHLTNKTHGAKIGKLSGAIVGTALSRCAYVLDVNPQFSGPVSPNGCYGEAVGSLGFFGTGSGGINSSLKFDSCEFNFAEQQGVQRGIPLYHISTTDDAKCTFDNCKLGVFAFFVSSGNVKLINGTQILPTADRSVSIPYRIGTRGTGCFITERLGKGVEDNDYISRVFDLSTGASSNKTYNSTQHGSLVSRDDLLGVYTNNINQGDFQPRTLPTASGESTGLYTATVSTSGQTLAINWTSNRAIIGIGDICRITDDSGMSFYYLVNNDNGGGSWGAIRVSGYYDDGSFTEYESASSVKGRYHTCTRLYGTSDQGFGTLTSGSNIITDCGRGDGFFGDIANEYQVGDTLWISGRSTRLFALPPTITAIDEIGKTITLDQNASISESIYDLPIAIRN